MPNILISTKYPKFIESVNVSTSSSLSFILQATPFPSLAYSPPGIIKGKKALGTGTPSVLN